MIWLGYSDDEKRSVIANYCATHEIRKTVVIAPEQYMPSIEGADHVTYVDAIKYPPFYRLLQEVDKHTLIVLSECLRTQNRYDLTYNCIRHFLNQTDHALVFQYLPQIDEQDDFMILFDFVTHSRWKRRSFNIDLILDNAQVNVNPVSLSFNRLDIPTSQKTKDKYSGEKEKLFAGLGNRDPHTLPRNLYLIGGADKLTYANIATNVQSSLFDYTPKNYIARNQRLQCECISTYQNIDPTKAPFTLVEFPHRFIDFSDFLYESKQSSFDVLVADLKVDGWYWQRFNEWKDRINATYASLLQR